MDPKLAAALVIRDSQLQEPVRCLECIREKRCLKEIVSFRCASDRIKTGGGKACLHWGKYIPKGCKQ